MYTHREMIRRLIWITLHIVVQGILRLRAINSLMHSPIFYFLSTLSDMHENVDTRSMSKWIVKTLIRFSPRAKNNEVFFWMCWWHSFSLYVVAVISTLMKKIGRRKVYLVYTSSSELPIEGCQDRTWNRKPIRTLLSNLHTVTPAQKTFLSSSACSGVATPTLG